MGELVTASCGTKEGDYDIEFDNGMKVIGLEWRNLTGFVNPHSFRLDQTF